MDIDNWQEVIFKILTKISQRRDADDFMVPVAWQEFGLFDYPHVIKVRYLFVNDHVIIIPHF